MGERVIEHLGNIATVPRDTWSLRLPGCIPTGGLHVVGSSSHCDGLAFHSPPCPQLLVCSFVVAAVVPYVPISFLKNKKHALNHS